MAGPGGIFMMKLYKTRVALAAWILNTNSESINRRIGHFTYRKHPEHIPMTCPRCKKAIPPGGDAWVRVGGTDDLPEVMATCVGCADA